MAGVVAVLEAEGELVEVTGQVLRADPMEGTPQPELEVREDGVAPREDLASRRIAAGRQLSRFRTIDGGTTWQMESIPVLSDTLWDVSFIVPEPGASALLFINWLALAALRQRAGRAA
jgi:hypothetical protein